MKFLSKFFELLNGKESTEEAIPQAPVQKEKAETKPQDIDGFINEEAFPGYTIERNVHPQRFDSDAHPSCMPISYLFSRDGEPKLAVLFLGTNQYRSMIARGTYEVLENNKIYYIRFFKEYKNDKEYVTERISSYLQ